MKRIAPRSIATVAIMATLAFGTPLAAYAGSTTPPTGPTQALTPQHLYQVNQRHYLEQLKLINHTFVAAIKTAKSNFSLAISASTNSTQRISARASYKLAIAEATVARANSLVALGNPPLKPHGSDPSPS